MNTVLFPLAIIVVFLTVIGACKPNKPEAPEREYNYTLAHISYIPDSSKVEYQKFITETVRAASQNMTGGDYEDADDTIEQAEETAARAFSVYTIGLSKSKKDGSMYVEKRVSELTPYEKTIYDSLVNVR